MASLLYVFPHPDDESFGPAPTMARYVREGHEVHLLTLTHGEATTQRERLGFSKEDMGQQRRKEMGNVEQVLSLTSLSVLDFADGELAELDPRVLEEIVSRHARECQADVLVTYAIHGVSGHRDHLACHPVVKRVFCQMRAEESEASPRRLALFTLSGDLEGAPDHLQYSPSSRIDARVTYSEADFAAAERSLEAYETYQSVVEEHQPLEHVREGVCFELFDETFDPPLQDLVDRLPALR